MRAHEQMPPLHTPVIMAPLQLRLHGVLQILLSHYTALYMVALAQKTAPMTITRQKGTAVLLFVTSPNADHFLGNRYN